MWTFDRRVTRLLATVALVAGTLAIQSCASDAADQGGGTRAVPGDYPTIQTAVDASRPGDLVLISPGIYHEAVTISTANLVIRGADRNAVVLDGQDRLDNGFTVIAGGVAIENLTVAHYQQNGVLFNGAGAADTEAEHETDASYGEGGSVLLGYRTSYVTTYNNGLYGIYAFSARGGTIEHVYASGHPDSGIYVGQCRPCNVVIRDALVEHNAIGYYGTNASGGVYVVESTFRENRLGLTPNSQEMELLAPQEETVIAGNLVIDNDDAEAPAIGQGFFGGGIAIGGGAANVVTKNRVSGHPAFGIGVLPLGRFDPERNTVEGNVLTGNDLDLAFLPREGASTTGANCFADNRFETSVPEGIEQAMPCPGVASSLVVPAHPLPAPPPNVDYRTVKAPGPQPTMPNAPSERAMPASATPPTIDLAEIDVPAAP